MSSGEFRLGNGAAFPASEKLTASATTPSHTATTSPQQGFVLLLVVVSQDFRVTDSPLSRAR
jgi:hypothetical protein